MRPLAVALLRIPVSLLSNYAYVSPRILGVLLSLSARLSRSIHQNLRCDESKDCAAMLANLLLAFIVLYRSELPNTRNKKIYISAHHLSFFENSMKLKRCL